MIPPVADRFVAGASAAAALDRVAALEDRGISAILNLTGEHHDDPAVVADDADAYVALIEALAVRDSARADAAAARADGGHGVAVSPKPTQLGLGVDEQLFREQLGRILDAAAGTDVRVWLDMEAPSTVSATLATFRALAPDHPGRLGVCLQANLDRTLDDIAALADVPGGVRLVKGAYAPGPEQGVRDRDAVDERYERCLERALADWDGLVAAGTHDLGMVARADELAAEHGRDYQVQMLMGVREDDQDRLASDHDVAQYVPYGDRWLAYFYRRIRERKENVVFALKALFGR